MSDILSPEEISALLNTCNTAQSLGKSKQIRNYDFTRPDRFSREQLKTLNSIHGQFTSGFSNAITELLDIPIEAKLLSIDQMAYKEYCDSLPESTLFYGVALEPLTSTAIFEFNPAVAEACIDGLTGGTGAISTQLLELTVIDRSIMASVVEVVLKKYEEAWATQMALKTRVQLDGHDLSTNRISLSTEQVAIFSFEVKIGDTESMMSVCIPSSDIAAALPENKIKAPAKPEPTQAPIKSALLEESLGEIAIESKAILGRASLAMSDIINLQIGDIIKLDENPNTQVELWLGDKPAYEGVAGLTGGNVGLRITRALPQEKSQKV